jgi:hypothetical protein
MVNERLLLRVSFIDSIANEGYSIKCSLVYAPRLGPWARHGGEPSTSNLHIQNVGKRGDGDSK